MKSEINKDNLTDLNRVTADTAEAEKEEAAAELGKFKDVQTLYKAYTDLEAEFTRRSQRLRELEKGNKAPNPSDGQDEVPSQSREEELLNCALSNEKVRSAIIGEYLKGVCKEQGVPLIAGGGGVAAPKSTPKTVKEAGRLAKQYFGK